MQLQFGVYLFMWFHDDCHALARDMGQHLQGVHGLLPHGGVGGGDLANQVVCDHVEGLVLGGQQLFCLFFILQWSRAAHEQLL